MPRERISLRVAHGVKCAPPLYTCHVRCEGMCVGVWGVSRAAARAALELVEAIVVLGGSCVCALSHVRTKNEDRMSASFHEDERWLAPVRPGARRRPTRGVLGCDAGETEPPHWVMSWRTCEPFFPSRMPGRRTLSSSGAASLEGKFSSKRELLTPAGELSSQRKCQTTSCLSFSQRRRPRP